MMFNCPHCGDRHHVNDFCATGPYAPLVGGSAYERIVKPEKVSQQRLKRTR